jgi:hypothetical protein
MNEHVTPIANTAVYAAGMEKGLVDKTDFLASIDADVIVEYGCAEGAVLNYIRHNDPDKILVGFDIDEGMLARGRERFSDSGILFTADWEEVRRLVNEYKGQGKKVCLVLNSIVHEVHSYLTDDAANKVSDEIWGRAGIEWDFITFRDMMVNSAARRPSDPIMVARVRQVYGKRPGGKERLASWEENWGSISGFWSLIHFFLTYRYTHNWQREMKENYLPVAYEDFLCSIPDNYFPIFEHHYTLPFLRREIEKDFALQLHEPTHLKIILRRLDR